MIINDVVKNKEFPEVLTMAFGGCEDDRGVFSEVYNQRHELMLEHKIRPFKQLNISSSKAGTFRGMHMQTKNPQGKLVIVVGGQVCDFFGDGEKFAYQILVPGQAIYVPPGLYHGFFAAEATTIVYGCTELYDEESSITLSYKAFPEKVVRHLDKNIKYISEKDANAPMEIV